MRVETYENHGSPDLGVWGRWDSVNKILTISAKHGKLTGQLVTYADADVAREVVKSAITALAKTLVEIEKDSATADFKRFIASEATEPNPVNVAQKGIDPNLIVGD